MATGPLLIEIRFAWWLHWVYLPLIYAGCFLGFEPDQDKLVAAFKRAMRFRYVTRAAVLA